MAVTRIAIIGTGVIGTSLGLALKASSNTSLHVVGHDKDFERAKDARKRGAFDDIEWNLINTVEDADIVVLALPTAAIRPTLEAIHDEIRPGTLVTDTADVKQPVLAMARELLPAHSHFVGGNPLVRSEGLGVEAGRVDLFRKKRYALTPAASANEEAVDLMVRLVEAIGAKPLFLDPAEHDSLVAGVRHLPALLAVALLRATAESSAWREMATIAGPIYESMTQLPADDGEELREFFLSNRAALRHWIDSFEQILHDVGGVIESGDEERIDDLLSDIAEARLRWTKSEAAYRAEEGGLPFSEREEVKKHGSLSSLLGFGGLGRRRRD